MPSLQSTIYHTLGLKIREVVEYGALLLRTLRGAFSTWHAAASFDLKLCVSAILQYTGLRKLPQTKLLEWKSPPDLIPSSSATLFEPPPRDESNGAGSGL